MLRSAAILLTLLCAGPALAQRDSTARTVDIERVEIAGVRPMKEIGVQRTVLDSALLRENISSSLADAFGLVALDAGQWAAVFALSLSVVAFGEAYKFILRRLSRARRAARRA